MLDLWFLLLSFGLCIGTCSFFTDQWDGRYKSTVLLSTITAKGIQFIFSSKLAHVPFASAGHAPVGNLLFFVAAEGLTGALSVVPADDLERCVPHVRVARLVSVYFAPVVVPLLDAVTALDPVLPVEVLSIVVKHRVHHATLRVHLQTVVTEAVLVEQGEAALAKLYIRVLLQLCALPIHNFAAELIVAVNRLFGGHHFLLGSLFVRAFNLSLLLLRRGFVPFCLADLPVLQSLVLG